MTIPSFGAADPINSRGAAAYPLVCKTSVGWVALDAEVAIIRRIFPRRLRPSVAHYSYVRGGVGAAGGSPLKVEVAGQVIDCGVVEAWEPLGGAQVRLEVPWVGRLERRDIGDAVVLADCGEGCRVEIGRRVFSYEQQRRALRAQEFRWERCEEVAVGEPLVVHQPSGAAPLAFPPVRRIWRFYDVY